MNEFDVLNHSLLPVVIYFMTFRVESGGEFPGLKTAVFGHFWAVSGAYERHTTPTYWSTFSPDFY